MEKEELLAIIGGHVAGEVLLRNEYLSAENEILRSKIKGRFLLTDAERIQLTKLGKRLGKKVLGEVGPIFTPDTILK